MSTSYYYCRKPVTSVRVVVDGTHAHITVWVGHGNAGTLVVDAKDASTMVRMFAEREDDDNCPMRSHWGGAEIGSVITENVRGLDPTLCLISEYGDVLTVQEIRNRAGAKRSDGWPTELFGYEVKETT